jgi:hypothetical protein
MSASFHFGGATRPRGRQRNIQEGGVGGGKGEGGGGEQPTRAAGSFSVAKNLTKRGSSKALLTPV